MKVNEILTLVDKYRDARTYEWDVSEPVRLRQAIESALIEGREELAGSQLWSQALTHSLNEVRQDMRELRKLWEQERSISDSLERAVQALQARLAKYESVQG